jgi:hypothetical protein
MISEYFLSFIKIRQLIENYHTPEIIFNKALQEMYPFQIKKK